MPNSLNSSSRMLLADDGTLFVISSDIYDAFQSMNEDTKRLRDWFKVNKLTLSISITDYILVTKANHLQQVGLILINLRFNFGTETNKEVSWNVSRL